MSAENFEENKNNNNTNNKKKYWGDNTKMPSKINTYNNLETDEYDLKIDGDGDYYYALERYEYNKAIELNLFGKYEFDDDIVREYYNNIYGNNNEDDDKIMIKSKIVNDDYFQGIYSSCCICISEYNKDEITDRTNKLIILQCGHVFHKECLIEWLNKFSENAVKNGCPYCRT
jgi:hypothetical protein